MTRYPQVAAFILAGGESSRMERDKALLNFGGVPLIVHTAHLIAPLVTKVTIVGSPNRYTALGLHVIADHDATSAEGQKQHGPLAGIVTALAETRMPWNLILACDLPYLSEGWVDWLLSRSLQSREEIVIPRTEHGLEPLAAVYRKDCAVRLADAFARGVRKITDAIATLRVDVVLESEWHDVDPSGLVLKNMNTSKDYEEAAKWWTASRLPGEKLSADSDG